jgi:cell division septation protein DedD
VSGRHAAEGVGLGWLATLGGASLLLALGFGIGLVAGSALEEPELVAKHLAGDATELPLPAPSAAPSEAPAPAPAAPRSAAPAERAAPEEAPSDFDTGDGREAPAPAPEAVGRPEAPPAKPPPRAPAPPATSRPPAPAVAASRPSGFAVQVGAFADRKAADGLVASLRGERARAYVVEGGAGESARYRVRVGPFSTRQQASDEAARLQKRRRLPTWVIAEGGT